MKRLAISVALLALSASAQSSVDPATAEGVRLIEAWADASQVYGRWPALSVAVGKGEDLVWSKGFGHVDAERKVPAQGDTIYSICSISKLFTSIAVMQQWEAGKLRLDEPITAYLPWARPKADDRDSLPITLRALLTHSAGVQRDSITGNWTGPDFPFPDRELLQSDFQAQPPLYPVGRVYQYSNIGISLAGEAAAAVSRQPFAKLVETGILTPLGLKDTRPFLPLDLLGTRLAVGWSPLDRTGQRSLLKPFDTKAITPAAGFSSTAEDLVRFGLWQVGLLRQEKAGASANVLRPSTLREMHRVQFTDHVRDGHWGLGFVVEQDDDESYVGHDGSCPGYHTAMLLRPDTETVVAVMTTDNHEVWDDALQVHKLLDARASHSFKGAPPASVTLEDYAGRYVDGTWENETIILPWNGGLVTLDLPDSNPAESLSFLKPIARDRFRRIAKDGSEMHEVSFERDSDGRVIAIVEFFNRSRRIVDAAQSVDVEKHTIAVIGTGSMGSALGRKLAGAGHRIVYGSRDPSRKEVSALVEATGHGASAASQKEATRQADIVILAVPWEPMEEVVRSIGELNGKILIDISTAYRQGEDGYLEIPVDSSTAELVQGWAPDARVVKTPFSAAQVIESAKPGAEPTVTYIAADDRHAKEVVARLAIQLSLFPLDAGPLRMAKAIDQWGLLYLTPLIQGRDLTWTGAPRVAVDYSCVSTEGWFRPVKDASGLAGFPNLAEFERQCASR